MKLLRRNMERYGFVLFSVVLFGAAFTSASSEKDVTVGCETALSKEGCKEPDCKWVVCNDSKNIAGKCLNVSQTKDLNETKVCEELVTLTTTKTEPAAKPTESSKVDVTTVVEKVEPIVTSTNGTNETTTAVPTSAPTITTTPIKPEPTTTVTPNTTTTSPKVTTTTTEKPTTTEPAKLSTTTIMPASSTPSHLTTSSPSNSSAEPHTGPDGPKQSRHFDAPSFIGGMVLSIGIMAISFVTYRFYRARTDRNYHTLLP